MVEYGAGRILAIAIKATSAPTRDDARHLAELQQQLDDRFVGGIVFHTGPRGFKLEDRIIAAPIRLSWA